MAQTLDEAGYREILGETTFFGKFWRILMWVFQIGSLIFAVLAYSGMQMMARDIGVTENAATALGSIGIVIGLVQLWLPGTLIIGVFILLTRPTKVLVPATQIETAPTQKIRVNEKGYKDRSFWYGLFITLAIATVAIGLVLHFAGTG